MRALNRREVISVLQKEFFNCWVLARDLDKIAKQANDPDITKLCRLIKENYKYPVDTVLVSSDLSVFGHINVNQPEAIFPNGYFSFLKKGLAKVGVQIAAKGNSEPNNAAGMEKNDGAGVPRKPPAGVKLTRRKPGGSLLEIARHNGKGPGIAMYPIDVSDFKQGGTIHIDLRVGSGGDATVQCELTAPHPQSPQFFVTMEAIPKIVPGETKTMKHTFRKDAQLMLVVKTLPNKEGKPQASAVLATITVKAGE